MILIRALRASAALTALTARRRLHVLPQRVVRSRSTAHRVDMHAPRGHARTLMGGNAEGRDAGRQPLYHADNAAGGDADDNGGGGDAATSSPSPPPPPPPASPAAPRSPASAPSSSTQRLLRPIQKALADFPGFEWRPGRSAGAEQLMLAHSPAHVRAVLAPPAKGSDGGSERGETGVPAPAATAQHASLVVVGAALDALDAILRDGYRVAGTLSGGHHHVARDGGLPEAPFNDLAVAAGRRAACAIPGGTPNPGRRAQPPDPGRRTC